MSKPIIYKHLKLIDNFNVAFPDKRVPNGYIDKSKTRVGITYTNFHDTRNTLTLIPSVAIIQDALDDYPNLNLFPVWDKVTPEHIAAYLQSDATYKRIVATPESFGKIITAARSIKRLQWLYKSFFLYLDEVHCYATEAYRANANQADILTPFDAAYEYVWKFDNMAMGTATVFEFSDARIQNLQRYKFIYREKFGKVTIVNDECPIAAMQYMLLHPDMFPGRVHIFFNSVIQIGDLIKATGITDTNVFCRDDERNLLNLEDAKVYFKTKPVKDDYAKFNFYSCRYNEGWDLKDDATATLILVTDVKIPHSLVGIPYKGFQAVGRLKVTPHKIYHITNNFGKPGQRSFEQIQKKWLYNADKHIADYNRHALNCKRDKMEDSELLLRLIKPFSYIKYVTAKLYHMTLDQIICDEYCKEHYNSAKSIRQTWEALNYETEVVKFDLSPIIKVKKSPEDINKQVVERWELFKNNPDDYVYDAACATHKRYQAEFQLLYEAYMILGIDELDKLGYNNKAMKAALIEKTNQNGEAKLRKQLKQEFEPGKSYIKSDIKRVLQSLYDELSIRNIGGDAKAAKATDLQKYGIVLDDCKAKDDKGVWKPAFKIVSFNCVVKQAS